MLTFWTSYPQIIIFVNKCFNSEIKELHYKGSVRLFSLFGISLKAVFNEINTEYILITRETQISLFWHFGILAFWQHVIRKGLPSKQATLKKSSKMAQIYILASPLDCVFCDCVFCECVFCDCLLLWLFITVIVCAVIFIPVIVCAVIFYYCDCVFCPLHQLTCTLLLVYQ